MDDTLEPLGRCPDCEKQIPTTRSLVEYQKSDGTEAIWAECPGCKDVVAPE